MGRHPRSNAAEPQRIIAIDGQLTFGFANRTRMAKKLCYKIVMVKGRGADKKRKKLYRKLIRTANEVFEMGVRCYDMVPTGYDLQLMALHEQLDHYLTLFGRGHRPMRASRSKGRKGTCQTQDRIAF